MQSVTQPHVTHLIESSGVDWITATSQHGASRWNMTEYARHERERLMDEGETIKQAYRLGYDGWSTDGFFYGQREGGTICVASGAVADRVHRSLINVSDNISRLDLQVTVATPTERPHLARQAYECVRSGSPAKVKVRNATIINTHPQGETLCIGKRASDRYARLYDKASEEQSGQARSRWRYEVEFKRSASTAVARDLLGREDSQAVALSVVHRYFDSHGVTPIFTPAQALCTHNPQKPLQTRNILCWFEESLSISVARAVRRYGMQRVLEALGIASQVQVMPEGGANDGTTRRHIDKAERHFPV
jgi:hypothetical protein